MKKIDKKLTITIGIPAYNEERTIGQLIKSMAVQRLSRVTLDQIIVYSDASTDRTISMVNKLRLKKMKIIDGKKRRGKANAMNKIIKSTTSDILVFLDGDILIRDTHMIEKLIDPILRDGADLTSARVKEYWTKNKFEDILKISMLLKKEIFESYKGGNNIYTCHGRARALSRVLYKKIKFNNIIVAEDAFAYLYTVYHGFVYRYAKRANVHYHLPRTFIDHQKQSVRFIQSYKQLSHQFGSEFIQKETRLPKRIAIPFVIKYFLRYPLTLGYYLSILIYMRVRAIFVDEIASVWSISPSTKGAFAK